MARAIFCDHTPLSRVSGAKLFSAGTPAIKLRLNYDAIRIRVSQDDLDTFRALIARVYATVQAIARPIWVSVQQTDDRYDDVLPESVRYVTDPQPEAGPLAGLLAGSRASKTTGLLAGSCDVPYLTPDVLAVLLVARTASAEAVVPKTPDRQCHPLCALYWRTALQSVVETHLADGRYAVHALLDKLNTVRIAVPAAPLRNVNRKTDL